MSNFEKKDLTFFHFSLSLFGKYHYKLDSILKKNQRINIVNLREIPTDLKRHYSILL